ncbi:hypothetical protein VPH35_122865 [Triticum aestivum]
MALRSLSSTQRQDVGSRASPPADSQPSTSQGGSGNGARANVARKAKEVEHILTNLKEEGVEIDDEIASIIDDDLTRIKAEAERENIINGLKRKGLWVMVSIISAAIGFLLGVEVCEQIVYAHVGRSIIHFGENFGGK